MNEYSLIYQGAKEMAGMWLIPFFPFLGAVINGLFGKKLQDRLGKRAVHTVAIGAMCAAALTALLFFVHLLGMPADDRFLHSLTFPMIHIGQLKVDMAFAIDPLSGMMALIITLVGTLIHIYSAGYMHDEPAYWRFFCYLNLFVFSMLLLVLGDNFVVLFFGWEGVGLCSYLLIGFWYTDVSKAKAGMKAFVVNRIGDFGFVTGLFFLFWGLGGAWSGDVYLRDASAGQVVKATAVVEQSVGHKGGGAKEAAEAVPPESTRQVDVPTGPTVSFQELRNQLGLKNAGGERPFARRLQQTTVWGVPLVFLVCLGLFIGACGKSAQIPLYVWLPDAMAGPTPVSALIHAATMVTAGVYMIARLNFLFALSPGAMTIVATTGALTALFAASIGFFQYDIKKVLAYSTVSQLGFMFLGVGTGAYWAGAFHLLTHACFKACLFLGSGSVIHGMHFLEHKKHAHGHGHDDDHLEHAHPVDLRVAPDPFDPQDMRNMGGLARLMPSTRWTYLLACITIAGFIPFAAFFSKDEILYKAYTNGSTLVPGPLLWLIGTVAALGTSFYMFRGYYMTFFYREPTAEMREHVHESPRSMTGVLWVLALASVAIGLVLGIPHHAVLEQWLEPVMALAQVPFQENSTLEAVLAIFGGIIVAGAGWYVARFFYLDGAVAEERRQAAAGSFMHKLLYNKYWVDELYEATIVRGTMALCRALAWIDLHLVDGLVNGTAKAGIAASWLSGQIDKWIVDGAVNGVADGIIAGGRQLRRVQTGRINNYAAAIAVGAIALILFVFLGQ